MTERIRVATLDDAPAVAALYDPYVRGTAVNFEVAPPTSAEMARRMEDALAHYPWLVLEIGGRVGGYAYATAWRPRRAYDWTAEVSIYLAPDAFGGGRARRLYGVLLTILARQGFAIAAATIALPNDRSVRFHESLGFRAAGVGRRFGFKLGAWRDVGWWTRELADDAAPPRPVVPFAEWRVLHAAELYQLLSC